MLVITALAINFQYYFPQECVFTMYISKSLCKQDKSEYLRNKEYSNIRLPNISS